VQYAVRNLFVVQEEKVDLANQLMINFEMPGSNSPGTLGCRAIPCVSRSKDADLSFLVRTGFLPGHLVHLRLRFPSRTHVCREDMIDWHVDPCTVKVPLDPVDVGIGATPDVEPSFSQDAHHLPHPWSRFELLVFVHDELYILFRSKVLRVRNSSLEEHSNEGVREDFEKGLVLLDLGQVGVVPLGGADPGIEEEFGGDAVSAKFVA
jgi:hypothetical protein